MAVIDSYDLSIEVTVKEGDNSTQRGALLETLAKRVLVSLQYEHVTTDIRVTGCELDIVARDKQSTAQVIVECKAYRDRTISADVLTKMLGNLFVHGYSSAWLITTTNLGKDAKGVVDKFKEKSIDERQKLRVYGPKELIELLISTGQICSPETLPLPAALHALSARTLLLTDVGEYWAVTAVGGDSGVADTVMVFDAASGKAVASTALIQQLSERDSNLRSLRWISAEEELATSSLMAEGLRQELDSIAPVPVADDWSDYRPARPEDFVGRDEILADIVKFFEEIRASTSGTRLLAIKAPSGWGKSSFLVKLRSTCLNIRNRNKFFLYSVDCRTATSQRYPELALKRCFDEAIDSDFVTGEKNSSRITSAGQPFSDSSIQSILEQLRQQNKVIVLFFDQFEEITTKQELSDLFLQIKMLCAAVQSANENVLLGFSWKTDGSIPTDHPAYHVWHSFADHRREFDLPLFSKADTGKLLTGLSKELRQPIEPSLRRLLTEHCQGYPWLLKKLCVHVFQVLKTQPTRQRELLERALDIAALFQKDLSDLNATQVACLEKIALDSPADLFRISEQFGEETVSALTQRRLIVRNSGKLVVYWDIFRDYVLTKQIPAIPTRYMPVSSPASAKSVLESLTVRQQTQLSVLEQKLGLGVATIDNIARDLVMMGVCQYDRKNAKLKLVHRTEQETIAAGYRFLSSHSLLKRLVDQFGTGFRGISLAQIETSVSGAFDAHDYAGKTIRVIALRLVAWLLAYGILTMDADETLTHDTSKSVPASYDELRIDKRRRGTARIFTGGSPPARVLDVIRSMHGDGYTPVPTDKNSLYALIGLGIISTAVAPTFIEKPSKDKMEVWLASKVLGQPSIRATREVLRRNPSAPPLEVGNAIEALAKTKLSEATKRRYGSGLTVWVNWIHSLLLVKPT
ncbi:restriction endonuclease [Polaromonas jejuensis]|uniref:Restriction endonuclease n=1 Tax=Polaromonas jejuensis TaxID=457502 RepID=A0ABW0Q4J1_9BURK|nr:restriction endonuclease [Polaromonas jejuensis]